MDSSGVMPILPVKQSPTPLPSFNPVSSTGQFGIPQTLSAQPASKLLDRCVINPFRDLARGPRRGDLKNASIAKLKGITLHFEKTLAKLPTNLRLHKELSCKLRLMDTQRLETKRNLTKNARIRRDESEKCIMIFGVLTSSDIYFNNLNFKKGKLLLDKKQRFYQV